jgi:hypothetical protein
VKDIRTFSGMVDRVSAPFRAYLRIACLEMERFRRGRERESAVQRTRNIEERFREIDKEKTMLLQSLRTQDSPASGDQPLPAANDGGFRFRY